MKTLSTRAFLSGGLSLSLAAAVALTACSGDQKEVAPPPEPTASAPTPPPPPPPTAEVTAAPTQSPDAGAPPKQQSSGRIAVLKQDSTEITDTFGSGPAKLQLGDKDAAILKIPENALRQGTNITFKVDTRGKVGGVQVGKIYHVTPFIPPATTSTPVTTEGPPFEFQFPAGTRKDANLAVGVITVDDKGREKIVWTIYAPKRIDDVTNTAYFEIDVLADSFVHVTTKAPTAAKK